MTEFILSLLSGSWGIVAMVGAAIAAVAGLYIKGRADGTGAANRRIDREYIKARQRIDNADMFDDDPSAAEAWLKSRQDNK